MLAPRPAARHIRNGPGRRTVPIVSAVDPCPKLPLRRAPKFRPPIIRPNAPTPTKSATRSSPAASIPLACISTAISFHHTRTYTRLPHLVAPGAAIPRNAPRLLSSTHPPTSPPRQASKRCYERARAARLAGRGRWRADASGCRDCESGGLATRSSLAPYDTNTLDCHDGPGAEEAAGDGLRSASLYGDAAACVPGAVSARHTLDNMARKD